MDSFNKESMDNESMDELISYLNQTPYEILTMIGDKISESVNKKNIIETILSYQMLTKMYPITDLKKNWRTIHSQCNPYYLFFHSPINENEKNAIEEILKEKYNIYYVKTNIKNFFDGFGGSIPKNKVKDFKLIKEKGNLIMYGIYGNIKVFAVVGSYEDSKKNRRKARKARKVR